MQIILLQDVPKVGRKFDVVDVSAGYATNFLLPQKLAEPATPAKTAVLEKRREAARAAMDAKVADLKEKLAALEGVAITLTAKADDQGHLYKKLHVEDIISALKDEHDIVLRKESVLLEAPIHELGDHSIEIDAAGEKTTITVSVVSE
jgi:large subunit ribosomal protein L9